MLENLFNSWAILAPKEIRVDNRGVLPLKDNGGIGLIHLDCIRPHEEDMLQGYIQRCIEARSEWDWMLVSGQNYAPKVYDTTVFIDGSEFLVNGKDSAVSSLLAAYVTALAAQRAIAPGSWRHFKGGVIDVLGEAFWSSGVYLEQDKDAILQGLYSLEEDNFKRIQLFKSGDRLFYLSEYSVDSSRRIFYDCNSMGYARKSEDFLGLVGSDHPEHEGKLRFVESDRNV